MNERILFKTSDTMYSTCEEIKKALEDLTIGRKLFLRGLQQVHFSAP